MPEGTAPKFMYQMRAASNRLVRVVTQYLPHVRMLWNVAPVFAAVSLLCTVLGAASAIVTMIATGRLVGALHHALSDRADAGPVWTWFWILTIVTIIGQLAQAIATLCNPRIWAAYRLRVQDLIADTAMCSRSLAPLDSEVGRELQVVTESSRHWTFQVGMTGTWALLSNRLIAVGSVTILLSWRWWVPFVVAASFVLVARLEGIWLDRLLGSLWGNPDLGRQQARYVSGLMVAPGAAKEVRLFGLAGWLAQRYSDVWNKAAGPFWQEANRRMVPFFVAIVPMIVVIGGSLGLLAHDAYRGNVSDQAVITYVLALLALAAFGPQGDEQVGLVRVAGMLRQLGTLRARGALPIFSTAERPLLDESNSEGGSDIDFEDVVFAYPTRGAPTLRHLSLHIPEGQSIAIVGVNGAGKSTLVKLLGGLYEVDSGSVRIGGLDVFTDDSVRGKVAVIFQDFVHYPLSLRDNVGFGAIKHRDDTDVLERAMVAAGGAEVFDRLDHDWDVILSREFDGGTELSGGQWQRIALARALAAVTAGAQILVMDEPTAALDVRAEAALFDKVLDVTEGVTRILVSHRLSAVRRAERIVVLDGATGRISEDGSHEQLINAGGAYAKMFTLQAMRFARAGTVDSQDHA